MAECIRTRAQNETSTPLLLGSMEATLSLPHVLPLDHLVPTVPFSTILLTNPLGFLDKQIIPVLEAAAKQLFSLLTRHTPSVFAFLGVGFVSGVIFGALFLVKKRRVALENHYQKLERKEQKMEEKRRKKVD